VRADKTETGRLLRAYHDRGDTGARDRLVEAYMPLVETLAQRHRQGGDEVDDLVQAGSIGLIKAIDRFQFERGADLSAYAVPNIEGEIKRHLRDTGSSVKVPRRLQEVSSLARRTGADLAAKLGRAPTTAELALELGLDEDEVASALESDRARVSVPFPKGDEASEAAEGGDGDTIDLSEDRLLLAGAFHVLDEEERRIVYMRFISGASRSQAARELGISQRHLSRRLSQALSKLRTELENGANGREGESEVPGKESTAPDTAGEVQRLVELPYHIVLTRDEEGDEGARWRARVEELVGCEARGDTPDEAARKMPRAMEQWIARALANGNKVPEPRSQSNSSGRLLLRMPRGLHAELAHHADREEVSLNGFITGLLAAAVGWQSDRSGAPGEAGRRADPPTVARRSRFLSTAILVNIVVMALAAIAAITLLIVAWQQGW